MLKNDGVVVEHKRSYPNFDERAEQEYAQVPTKTGQLQGSTSFRYVIPVRYEMCVVGIYFPKIRNDDHEHPYFFV